jgi:hypothetical protein
MIDNWVAKMPTLDGIFWVKTRVCFNNQIHFQLQSCRTGNKACALVQYVTNHICSNNLVISQRIT